jgi:transcriptional regulator with XRE-family HTH domain
MPGPRVCRLRHGNAAARPSPLRLRRLVRGLRIIDLARATGLIPVRISELERGECALAGHRLQRLARFYAVPPSTLVEEMGRWCASRGLRFLGPTAAEAALVPEEGGLPNTDGPPESAA